MKKTRSPLCAALCLAVAAALPAAAAERRTDELAQRLRDPHGPIMVVAHRGCHETAPENSLAAFARCIELGADIIELDARLTRDGELAVIHDDTLDRTTDGHGPVAAHSMAELKRLRLRQGGGGPDAAPTEHRIPTLREAMRLIDGRILVDLDAKGEDLPAVWEKAHALFRELGSAGAVTVKLTAARDDALADRVPLLRDAIYLQRVDQRLGLPLAEAVERNRDRQPAAYPVIFKDTDYLQGAVAQMRGSGARFWAEPFYDAAAAGLGDAAARRDPDASWGRLLDLGASVLLTDRPEALIRYLEARGLR